MDFTINPPIHIFCHLMKMFARPLNNKSQVVVSVYNVPC